MYLWIHRPGIAWSKGIHIFNVDRLHMGKLNAGDAETRSILGRPFWRQQDDRKKGKRQVRRVLCSRQATYDEGQNRALAEEWEGRARVEETLVTD